MDEQTIEWVEQRARDQYRAVVDFRMSLNQQATLMQLLALLALISEAILWGVLPADFEGRPTDKGFNMVAGYYSALMLYGLIWCGWSGRMNLRSEYPSGLISRIETSTLEDVQRDEIHALNQWIVANDELNSKIESKLTWFKIAFMIPIWYVFITRIG